MTLFTIIYNVHNEVVIKINSVPDPYAKLFGLKDPDPATDPDPPLFQTKQNELKSEQIHHNF